MPRTAGSVGQVRVEFEREFYRYCEQHGFRPGYACAKLMHKAADAKNYRDFVSLGSLAARVIAQTRDDEPQEQLTLVIDRSAQEAPQVDRDRVAQICG